MFLQSVKENNIINEIIKAAQTWLFMKTRKITIKVVTKCRILSVRNF